MSEVLYRKYRSQKFAEVVGQDHIVPVLVQAILTGKFSHAYLFSGPRGTGKTSVARLFARAVNCANFPDHKDICGECDACKLSLDQASMQIIEIDAASNRGINEIKQLKETLHFLPPGGKYKLYIIDEVHMLSADAFNALLKTIEEPPAHVIFIFATTELHKVPQTIMSRVQHFQFRLATPAQMTQKLGRILEAEGWTVDDDVLAQIYNYSEGSYRDAESLLGKLFAGGEPQDKKITLEVFNRVAGYISEQDLAQLVQYLLANDMAAATSFVQQLEAQVLSWYQLNKQLLTYLKNIILQKLQSSENYDGELRLLRHFSSLQTELRDASYPKLNFEIALITAINNVGSKPIVPAASASASAMKDPVVEKSEPKLAKPKLVSDASQSVKPSAKSMSASAGQELPIWQTYLNNIKKANIAFWLKLKPLNPQMADETATIIIGDAGTFALLTQANNKQILLEVWEKTAPGLTLVIQAGFAEAESAAGMLNYADNSNLVEQLL